MHSILVTQCEKHYCVFLPFCGGVSVCEREREREREKEGVSVRLFLCVFEKLRILGDNTSHGSMSER
jgi:hypothetical protein